MQPIQFIFSPSLYSQQKKSIKVLNFSLTDEEVYLNLWRRKQYLSLYISKIL